MTVMIIGAPTINQDSSCNASFIPLVDFSSGSVLLSRLEAFVRGLLEGSIAVPSSFHFMPASDSNNNNNNDNDNRPSAANIYWETPDSNGVFESIHIVRQALEADSSLQFTVTNSCGEVQYRVPIAEADLSLTGKHLKPKHFCIFAFPNIIYHVFFFIQFHGPSWPNHRISF